MAERLRNAVSPYLRGHADNPVDWYPWGEEAFAEAGRRGVPVLVSIGYATCHWCHVMARESFSDPDVAEQLREGFVAIKVDREEHPEVDAVYLAAASAFTRDLGWPLTVFTRPDGRAFYAGTYFPPVPIRGVPSFREVLAAVSAAWTERRGEVDATADAIGAALAEASAVRRDDPLPAPVALEEAAASLAAQEDVRHGGFGGAPKFPVAPVLGFLVAQGGDAAELAARSLRAMAASPLRDAVEGGFFRYATRVDWSEPHYERMLTDNALLLDVAARLTPRGLTAQGSGDALLDEVIDGLVRFLRDVLRLDGGVVASAQDSESTIDGVRDEGGYYRRDAAGRAGLEPPPLDTKVLTGWNGLAIGALARTAFVRNDAEPLELATAAADTLLRRHLAADGTLVRASRDGVASDAPATLEDVGMLAVGLLELAAASGDATYAEHARRLVDRALEVADPDAAVPFAAPGGADPVLAARGLDLPADPAEGATPSGVTVCADAAWRLHLLGAGDRYRDAAERAMRTVAASAQARPIAFGGALDLMTRMTQPEVQLVTVVPDSSRGQGGELDRATRRYAASVAVVVEERQARAFADAGFELFAGRTAGDGGLAYRCVDFVCALPVATARELDALG